MNMGSRIYGELDNSSVVDVCSHIDLFCYKADLYGNTTSQGITEMSLTA